MHTFFPLFIFASSKNNASEKPQIAGQTGKNCLILNKSPAYTEGSLFQVINLLGQQVLVGKTTPQLNVSALPQGSYVLKVGMEVGTEVAKFVKQ